MHGELFMTRCADEACASAPFVDRRHDFPSLPRCPCGALQRPHIVWFGEMPLEVLPIRRKVQACDLFLCIGSSGSVYPAAGLVRELQYRRSQGEVCRSVYLGLEAPANADDFDQVILGKAGELLPTLLAASFTVDLDPRRNGVAASVGDAEALLVVEDAQTKRLRSATQRGPAARGEEIKAPIAGKLVKLLCAVGDEIAAGQAVAVLEAMKMENEIVAERGGTVSEVARAPGQSVETGERLLVLV
jgi:biotin carboxyl carrier protein